MAATVIAVTKGDTSPFLVTVPWQKLAAANGLNPYHTGSGKLTFEGKLSITDPDSAGAGFPQALFTKTNGSGITVTTDGNNTTTNGVIAVTLSAADWATLLYDVAVTIICSLKGFDGAGGEYTIDRDIYLACSSTPTSKVM